MSPDLLPWLADPNDGCELQLHAFEGTSPDALVPDVREGVLLNPGTGRWYPIREGIPTLFADALRQGTLGDEDAAFAGKFEAPMRKVGCRIDDAARRTEGDFARIESERLARDSQAEDYDSMFALKLYQRIEAPVYRRALERDLPCNTKLPLLEAGCGTGRFTAMFSHLGSAVAAVDMSRDSILRNRVRHAGRTASSVHYIHADLTHLPLQSGVFGAVAHCGVYEHIPSRAMRKEFLAHARRVLTPSGVLLLAAYRYGGLTRLFGKEGEHDGGIPFIRFTEEELRSETAPYFKIEKFRRSLGIYMSMLLASPMPA